MNFMELEAFEALCEPGENLQTRIGQPELASCLEKDKQSEMSVPVPRAAAVCWVWALPISPLTPPFEFA